MALTESVANYFIQKSFETGVPLTPMKLIKLVYIAHGWHRGYFSKNLIDDAVEAWQYGPVIPELYHKVKRYGRGAVTGAIEGYGVLGDDHNPFPEENTRVLLDNVWQNYGRYDGLNLSAMTHQPGTPWDQTWNTTKGIIPNQLIEQHYKGKIQAAQQHG